MTLRGVLKEVFHINRKDGEGEEPSREMVRHVPGREVKKLGPLWEPSPLLYGRSPGFVFESDVMSAC